MGAKGKIFPGLVRDRGQFKHKQIGVKEKYRSVNLILEIAVEY